jgi:hypothetical protein
LGLSDFIVYVLLGVAQWWNVYTGHPPPTLGKKEGRKIHFFFLIFQKEEIKKNIFIIFYQGEQLRLKIKKICDG